MMPVRPKARSTCRHPSRCRFRPPAASDFAKKCRRRLSALSPKRHCKRGCPRITCRRFARFASNPGHGDARAPTFSKIFFTGDCAPSERPGTAGSVPPARCSAAGRDAAMPLMTPQKPLWNRCFKHFENIARYCARDAPNNARDFAPPIARAQQVVWKGSRTPFVKWKRCFFRRAVVIEEQCLRSP
jgi:hypothetical protein